METSGKSVTVDPTSHLVRRLSHLKAGFGIKVQQAERSAFLWQECKFSSKLYGQVEKDTEATRAIYDNVYYLIQDEERYRIRHNFNSFLSSKTDEFLKRLTRFILDHKLAKFNINQPIDCFVRSCKFLMFTKSLHSG